MYGGIDLMAIFYLIRHGEPDYDSVSNIGFFGFGRDFAPLTPEGIKQAETTAEDIRLLDADIIVSSPYTRALQTASIISRKTDKKIVIEPELHEWVADKTNTFRSGAEAAELSKEFNAYNGIYPDNKEMRWETLESLAKRIKRVADKYADLDKVVIVAHEMVFKTLAHIESMSYAEIVEYKY